MFTSNREYNREPHTTVADVSGNFEGCALNTPEHISATPQDSTLATRKHPRIRVSAPHERSTQIKLELFETDSLCPKNKVFALKVIRIMISKYTSELK